MENADIDNFESTGSDDSEKQNNLEIVLDVARDFTYASYQNAIPVIRSIRIENKSDRQFEGCRLELTSAVTPACHPADGRVLI